jgi:ABC-type branched-subunit amino acid transport system substrate-binding protein
MRRGNTSSSGSLNFTMTIGDVAPFTGDLGVLGAPADKAVTLAVNQLNKASKDAGVSVTLPTASSSWPLAGSSPVAFHRRCDATYA